MAANLAALFAAEGDRVFSFLLSRCGSRPLAEDLTAETFLAANRKLASGEGANLSRGWLFTVARHRLIDHWRSESARSRRMERLQSEALRVHESTGTSASADGIDQESSTAEALASLSERYRAALVLRYLEDFSVSEVADALGLSYKAAESVLSRARASFVRAYQEIDETETGS